MEITWSDRDNISYTGTFILNQGPEFTELLIEVPVWNI